MLSTACRESKLMLYFKLGFAVLYAVGAGYVCYVVATKQILKALQTGQWRARTGVADRHTSPKTFWFFVIYTCLFLLAGVLTACFLLVMAFLNR
jgi:hypothetical protein